MQGRKRKKDFAASRKNFSKIANRSRIGTFFRNFFEIHPLYPYVSTNISVQSTAVGTQPINASENTNPSKNTQVNPQPTVTGKTLQTLNGNFLHDLHRLKKSYTVRPTDNVKPKSIGEKLLNALKSFGHAVRSLMYGSKNAETILRTRFNELKKLSTDIKNANITDKEYKKIRKQTNANIKEIKNFLSSAKEEHKSLLDDCLKLYESFATELRFYKRRKWDKFEPFPTDPEQRANIQTLANNWKQKIKALTKLKDGNRIPNKKLSKDDIQSLKDAFAALSKAWVPFGEKQTFKNVMSQEEYVIYAELYGDIMNAYAKQQDKAMSNFIRGYFTGIVQEAMGKENALYTLRELQEIEKSTTGSASVDLRQQLQLLKILLTLQASPDDKEAIGKLLSDQERMPKEEDCIFLVKHLQTLKEIAPNSPLVDKIEKVKSDLPGYLSACYEQNTVNSREREIRDERLLAAAKLYASDTQPGGVFNMNIEQLRRNLETDRKISEKSGKINNGKTTAKLTPAEDTRRFEMPDRAIRNKIGLCISIQEAFRNEAEAIEDGMEPIGDIGKSWLEDLSYNNDNDISTAAKAALKRLGELKQKNLRNTP